MCLALQLGACEQLRAAPFAPEPLAHRFEPGCTAQYTMRVWEGLPREGALADAADEERAPDAEYLFAYRPSAKGQGSAPALWIDRGDPSPSPATQRHIDLHEFSTGPAAPDVACRDREHDPFEDFVALTFVRFDGLSRDAGESWRGAPVFGDGSTCRAPGSCCAALSCATVASDASDERTGSGRDPAQDGPWTCDLGAWSETWRPDHNSSTRAHLRLHSSWSNGQNGRESARAARSVDFDADRGRVLRSIFESEIAAGPHRRRVEIVALDACNGIQPLARDGRARKRLAQIFPTP